MKDQETGEKIFVNSSSKKVRNHYKTHYLGRADYCLESFKKSGAGTISCRIDESYVKKLLGYFKRRG